MLEKLEVPKSVHYDLKNYSERKGIAFISSAFDHESLYFLDTIGLEHLKIPSGEITNGPLLYEYGKTKRNLIMSTGMSTMAEIQDALGVIAFGLTDGRNPFQASIY